MERLHSRPSCIRSQSAGITAADQVIGRVRSIALIVLVAVAACFYVTESVEARKLYVTDTNGGAVQVIDEDANEVVPSPIGDGLGLAPGPYGIAISPDAARAYVSSDATGSNTVSAIDTATDSVVDTIVAQSRPRMVAISPDGERVYVSNWDSNNVSVISTLTNESIQTFTAGTTPWGLALTPDGRKLYVSNFNSANVSVLNAETGVELALAIGVGDTPRQITVLPDGTKAYVANSGSDTVSVIDTETNTLQATIPVGDTPIGAVASPDGRRVYITDNGSDTVSVIDVGTDAVIDTVVGLGVAPDGIALTPDGSRAYVANNGTGTVSMIDLNKDRNVVIGNPIIVGASARNLAGTPNQAPRAAFTFTAAQPGEPTTFDTGTALDPDGEIASYDWDFGDDTILDDGGPNPTHVFEAPGTYNVSLTVTDDEDTSTPDTSVYTGQTYLRYGNAAATLAIPVEVRADEEPGGGNDEPIAPPSGGGSGGNAPQSLGGAPEPSPLVDTGSALAESYDEACSLRFTSPKLKKAKRGTLRISRKTLRRLLRHHGFKAEVTWGRASGQDVFCEDLKMVLLEKRGKRYVVPGIPSIQLSPSRLTAKSFEKRAVDYLKKKGIGKLRWKYNLSKRKTKLSFKPYRRSKFSRRALRRLRKTKKHRTYVLMYTTTVGDATIKKEVKLKLR